DDVDEVEDDAPLAAHDHVEVAQADVEIDDDGPVAAERQACADGGRRGGLADAALAGRDNDYLGQGVLVTRWGLLQGLDAHRPVPEKGLDALLPNRGAEIIARPVKAGDGDELCLQ